MSPCVQRVRMSLGYIPGKEISTIHYVQLQFLRTVGILESSRVNFPHSPTVFDFYASSTTSLIVQFFCFFLFYVYDLVAHSICNYHFSDC